MSAISAHRYSLVPLCLAAAATLMPVVGMAQDSAASRSEIERLRADYDARLAALEQRLSATPQSGFNPDISLILQGQYLRQNDLAERQITGFWPAGGHAHEDEGGEPRGFTLDHTELVMSANVDQLFRGLANFALIDDAVEVEEAWFQTLGLGGGVTLKGGRFLSGIGYLNELHPHAWDFADQPLVYRALFGEHYAQDGVQLKWVAPTDLFVEVGAEAGRGTGFPGTDRNRNGAGSGALFAHVGGDVGVAHAWRAGVSWLTTRAEGREGEFEDSTGEHVEGAFTGKSRTWLADVVWKWAPGGDARTRHLKLQGEYFRRTEDGTLTCTADAALLPASPCVGDPQGDFRSRQTGWYAQAVFQFMPRWRVGYRYDRLDSGSVTDGLRDAGVLAAEGPLATFRPQRHSVMADWSPSEFSRVRLQLARDRSMAGLSENHVRVQYIMSLGAHGAHRF